jgi:hypothetical protein
MLGQWNNVIETISDTQLIIFSWLDALESYTIVVLRSKIQNNVQSVCYQWGKNIDDHLRPWRHVWWGWVWLGKCKILNHEKSIGAMNAILNLDVINSFPVSDWHWLTWHIIVTWAHWTLHIVCLAVVLWFNLRVLFLNSRKSSTHPWISSLWFYLTNNPGTVNVRWPINPSPYCDAFGVQKRFITM